MSLMKEKRKRITIIQAPFGLGGAIPGAEKGPTALMEGGLAHQLSQLVWQVDMETIQQSTAEVAYKCLDITKVEPIRFYDEVKKMCKQVADSVHEAVLSESFPLILGGDHSVAMGSLAGLARAYKRLGVIWLDAHGDMNTESTSPSGNAHGMVLSVATGLAEFKLTDIAHTPAMLPISNIVLVGARDLDLGEKQLLSQIGIHCFTISDIDRLGIEKVMRTALSIASENADGVHLSLDMDVLDPLEAPGVGTPVDGGLTYREARYAMELLCESEAVTSMDLVEVNPSLDSGGRTVKLAIQLAEALFGKRQL